MVLNLHINSIDPSGQRPGHKELCAKQPFHCLQEPLDQQVLCELKKTLFAFSGDSRLGFDQKQVIQTALLLKQHLELKKPSSRHA